MQKGLKAAWDSKTGKWVVSTVEGAAKTTGEVISKTAKELWDDCGSALSRGADDGAEAAGKARKVAPDSGPIHHIATNKNSISNLRGGPWTPRFEPILKKAGMTLEDAANKIRVPGHAGPHPEAYHQEVFDRLRAATNGLSGADYKSALLKELDVIAGEATTVGSRLNKLLTGG